MWFGTQLSFQNISIPAVYIGVVLYNVTLDGPLAPYIKQSLQ